MNTSFKKTITARELPPSWQQEGRFAPDDRVTVWVEPEDAELATASSLSALMDTIGRRAEARGLTPEKLKTILHEE